MDDSERIRLLEEENNKLKESLTILEWEYRELKEAFSKFIQAIRGAADAVEEAIFSEEDTTLKQ